MAVCSDWNETCSFDAKTNGTHGEKLYIFAHHNGHLNETKPTEMFKMRACSIENVIPGVPFTDYKLMGKHPILSFSKWKFVDSTCQQHHGEKLKYAITNSQTQRAQLENFNEFSICHEGDANCTFPATKIDGLEVEQNLFIRAYYDGIIDFVHSKTSSLFTTYRCGIDLIKSSVNFESAVISPEEKYIQFPHWTFTTARCQNDHGKKVKYAIS